MEQLKKRKSEEYELNCDMSNIVLNQEKIISYIFQLGSLCQNIENKLDVLNAKIQNIETKNNHLENSINKFNNIIFKELKNKDLEITSLKELNQNIIQDYNVLLNNSSNNSSSNTSSSNSPSSNSSSSNSHSSNSSSSSYFY